MGPGRFRLQPTPSGVVVAVVLVAFLLVAPEVADPSMAGFVWAAGFGALVIGVVWPCVVVMTSSVSDGTSGAGRLTASLRTGERHDLVVSVGARLSEVSLRWVDAPADEVVVVSAGGVREVSLPMTPVRRGRFEDLAMTVRSDAPFGLCKASRVLAVGLVRPLVVGPAALDAAELPELPLGAVGEVATTAVGHGGDTTRSVRPYVTGDPAHLVHWPTTARTGGIVVREMEPPADRAVAVVVDLGAGPVVSMDPRPVGGANGTEMPGEVADGVADSGRSLPVMPTTPLSEAELPGEEAVTKAATIIAILRRQGVRVLLATAEPATHVAGVGSDADIDARLAAATPGAPGAVPPGWPVLRIGVATSAATGGAEGRGC